MYISKCIVQNKLVYFYKIKNNLIYIEYKNILVSYQHVYYFNI